MTTLDPPLPKGLDPSLLPVLNYIAGLDLGPRHIDGPEPARRALDNGAVLDAPVPDGVSILDDAFVAGDRSIPLRVYTPPGTPRGTVLFFHGGGFVLGSLESHHRLCGRLAAQAGSTVVSVAYRLAPEHRFPAAVEDALASLEWLVPRLDSLGGDGSGFAVAGDSAGGNLAAVLAQQATGQARDRLRLQVLMYPVTDMMATPELMPSLRENATGLFLTLEDMVWFNEMYRPAADSPLASPARAATLRGLAPALIITAEFDPLRDDGERYAALLRDAGVSVTMHRYEGQIHGFVSMAALVAAAHTAMEEIAAAVRQAVS